MSWQRRQQEIGRRRARKSEFSDRPFNPRSQINSAQPFPLIRPVEASIGRQLSTVISTVFDELGGSEAFGVSVPVNKYRGNRLSVCLVGVSEMKRYPKAYWPEDPETFVDELAHKTETSDKALLVRASGIGLFGSNHRLTKSVGVTFDEIPTKILKHERLSTTGLIVPGSEGIYSKFYPHITIGEWAVSMEILQHLRPMLLEHVQNLGEIALQPVTAKYIDSNS